MRFLDLPNEVIFLLIPQREYESDINALCRTTRQLYELLNPILYKRSTTQRNGGYTLEWAAIKGYTPTAKLVLEAGAPPDACGSNDWQPFVLAALHGHAEIIALLYEHGVDPCSTENDWKNHLDDEEDLEDWLEGHPFSVAATSGHLPVVTLLLQYCVRPDLPTGDYESKTALHLAAEHDHLDIVRVLLDAGCPVDVLDVQGANPLVYAAQEDHLDIVQFLLSHGSDPNISNENEGTSLCMASRSGNINIVRYLLDHGATPNPSYPDGQKPLFQLSRAAEEGNYDIVDLLFERFDYVKSSTAPYQQAILLCIAAMTGRTDLLHDLLTKHHYDPNLLVTDERVFLPYQSYYRTAESALAWAAEKNQPAAAEILLTHGANVSPAAEAPAEAPHGTPPLLRATKRGNRDVVAILFRHGADPNNPPCQALYNAVGHPQTFKLLLDNGADPTLPTRDSSVVSQILYSNNVDTLRILLDHPHGRALVVDPLPIGLDDNGPRTTPLFRRAVLGGELIVRLLLEQGLLIPPTNLHDKDAGECLINAVSSGAVPLMRLLLEIGFDVNAGDNAGYLIYRTATANTDPEEFVDFLVENGCTIDDRDRGGRTALYLAAFEGREGAMRLLLERGADPRVRCSAGDTPVSIAASEGKLDAVKLLLKVFDERGVPLSELEGVLFPKLMRDRGGRQGSLLSQFAEKIGKAITRS